MELKELDTCVTKTAHLLCPKDRMIWVNQTYFGRAIPWDVPPGTCFSTPKDCTTPKVTLFVELARKAAGRQSYSWTVENQQIPACEGASADYQHTKYHCVKGR